MKSKSFQKFINNFTNEEENYKLNESSDDESENMETITIRKLQMEDIPHSNLPFNSNEEEKFLDIKEKLGNALITISVEDLTENKEEKFNIENNNEIDAHHEENKIKAAASSNKIKKFLITPEENEMDCYEGSPRILKEKQNPTSIRGQRENLENNLTENGTLRNSARTRPSHRKNFSMMISENSNHDPDLDWRGKDRSMSQTVDLNEPKNFLINNIKYLYDSNTNRSKKRVQQMRKMQVSKGSISSGMDMDDNFDFPITANNEISENTENKMINIRSIKPEANSLHIKNKTIDMTSPDFKIENVKTAIPNLNSTNSYVNSSNTEKNEQFKIDQIDEKEEINIVKFPKHNLPCIITVTQDLLKVDSERTINANLSTAPQLTTPILTNENIPASTKNQTSAYQEDTEVVISDLEGSIENKGDETNDDNLFSLSCSYSHKSFIPITNSLKSKKDIKEENATPSYLLALSQCMTNRVEDELENNKPLIDLTKSNFNLTSYENLDSLENESLKLSQNRFSTDRNKNNVYRSMKEVKHFRLPSGKNYFINSIIEEEFSEICSDSELSFKKHSYLFSKGKLDASCSEKKFSLQSSKEFQVEKNLENLFFNKMKNNHSNSKSEIPSELNNNMKNQLNLNLNMKQQNKDAKDAKIEKNEIFNVQIDLKKNFDEIKKKIIEEEERSKAKVENKKKEILDLFFNKTKNASTGIQTTNISNTNNSKNDSENPKKNINKIMINLNKIDVNKISPRSPSPPIKDKKSPSSKCREECYQDNSDRSKKNKKIEDLQEINSKFSKEDFDMKILSPLRKQLNDPIEINVKEPSPIRRNENIERKPNSISNISAISHKALKEIYKRQREQKSKNSSIFKSEDLRISKPDGITIQTAQNDSSRKIKEMNTNTFNSINEQFSLNNINNNICTPLSMKNEIVEYGVATERANDKIINNQFDLMKNNISTNNELCQASPISYLNNNSNRKSINLNLNFSSKQENFPAENLQITRNLQQIDLKRILFDNDSDLIKSEKVDKIKENSKIYKKDEISVSNEITINIINHKEKIRETVLEKKNLKEILENVKIDPNRENNDKSLISNKDDLAAKEIPNHKIEKIEKNHKNEISKVNLLEVLKRETFVQHKKNVSLNPKIFLNQDYKLNNLHVNNKDISNKPNINETKQIISTSIGINSACTNSNKAESHFAYSSNNSNTINNQSLKLQVIIPEKENKNISNYLTNNPENPKIATKNNFINHYVKNKTRSSSDSSVKFNHINELLTKQHSSLLQVPNPILISYNPGAKKVEKKSNPNLNIESIKLAPPLKSANNNRNLSHDIKATNTLSINNNVNIKKIEHKKFPISHVNKNNSSSSNSHNYSTNNSNVESSYSSLGSKANSGIPNRPNGDKTKNNSNSQKAQCAIPKIPNSKKNTTNYKTLQSNNSGNNLILNHEEMFKLYDKIKNMNIEKNPRNDSKSKWK